MRVIYIYIQTRCKWNSNVDR